MTSTESQQPVSLDNHKPAMAELGDLIKKKKLLEERIKVLRSELGPVLADRGKIAHAGYVFNMKMMAGRKSLDKKAMEADGIDVDAYYKQGAPFTQLSVEEIEEA